MPETELASLYAGDIFDGLCSQQCNYIQRAGATYHSFTSMARKAVWHFPGQFPDVLSRLLFTLFLFAVSMVGYEDGI